MKTYSEYTPEEKAREIAFISSVISDNFAEELYNALEIGYISTMYFITDLAEKFFNENLDNEWVDSDGIDQEIIDAYPKLLQL